MSTELTLAEEIKSWKVEELIEFLKQEDLMLEDAHFDILRNQEMTGRAFLKTSIQQFMSYGLKGGPATVLADFAKECVEQKKRAFSSYKTLKDLRSVLKKYGLTATIWPTFLNLNLLPSHSPMIMKNCNNVYIISRC